MNAPRPDGVSRRSIRGAPVLQATLLQLIAFGLMLATAWLIASLSGFQFSIAHATLLQAAIASFLTWGRMEPWWIAIQFIFPLAVIGALAVQLPPILYLGIFLLSVALFWSTFRTRVPYYPSTSSVWSVVESQVPVEQPTRLMDIGCGFGGMALRLAASRPNCKVEGIELAPLPWCVSSLRACMARSRASFQYGDYQKLHFAEYDIVFAYLSPAAMPELWQKAKAEMRPGSLLLSNEFSIPGIEPASAMPCADGRILYAWRL
jgi:SAM-dependent methyltransferase